MSENIMFDNFDVDIRQIMVKEGVNTHLERELEVSMREKSKLMDVINEKDQEIFDLMEETMRLQDLLEEKIKELER